MSDLRTTLFFLRDMPRGFKVNSALLRTNVKKPFLLMRVSYKTESLLLNIALIIFIFDV